MTSRFLLALALFSGMTLGGDPCTADERTLRVAGRNDIPSLDPVISYEYYVAPLLRLVYECLLDYDDDVALTPCLAAALPTVSSDGRTYTFQIREGVSFSDGTELTAQDFVYSLSRLLDPTTKSPGATHFAGIRGARGFMEGGFAAWEHGLPGLRATGRYELVIELEQADPTFLYKLTLPYASAVSRSAVQAAGPQFRRRPVGTGPFTLAAWKPGTRIRFNRNPAYWDATRPRVDAVEMIIGPDDVTQQMMFERGELDLMLAIAGPDYIRLRGDPRWAPHFTNQPLNATVFIALNCEKAPLNDVRVRQALNYAIDRQRLLRFIGGRGVISRGVLPPRMPGYSASLTGYTLDLQKARMLLSDAGLSNGFTLPICVAADYADGVKMMESVQQDLARINVRLEITLLPSAIWSELVSTRGAVTCSFTNWFQTFPDPADVFDLCLNGDHITEAHCSNTAFYSSPLVNDRLQEARAEPVPDRRLACYAAIESRVVTDAPWVFLYHPVDYRLHQPWIKGDHMHPVWAVRYDRIGKEPR